METACGTGIVTAAINRALPDTRIVATDLNASMLEEARARSLSDRVRFEVADAQSLPFEDASFDLVVCQFGAMFYPDKMRANIEALRVLREGGRYLGVVWDSIDGNLASKLAMEAAAKLFQSHSAWLF